MNNYKLKILFVTADKYPPFRVDLTVLFGKEIIGKGHSIDWIMQSEKPLKLTKEEILFGGTVFVGATSFGHSIFSRVRSLLLGIIHDFKLFPILKLKRYDVVLVKDKFIAGLLAVIASRLVNVKFIYWLSFPFPEDSFFRVKEKTVNYPLLYWLRGAVFSLLLYKVILLSCDHAFVQTEYMKEKIKAKGIPGIKMTAVPMAVSLEDTLFYGHNLKVDYAISDPLIVYIGTLIKIRRMEFLLRAFKIVLRKERNAKLYLVGGSEVPSDIDDLRLEAKKLDIEDSVIITGFLPQKEAWQYVKMANVCVSPIYPSPSFDVGSPTKLLEYMAMGKASVANDHPEQKVILAESKAGICVPYNETAFAEAILYIINNQHIANEMGKKGRQYIKKKRNYKKTSSDVEKKIFSVLGD
jgi:glycosyltransferase involved in cell wall biosynthesis